MADNVVLNPGVGGDSLAAKDVAGVKFQRVINTTAAGADMTPLQDSTFSTNFGAAADTAAANDTVTATFLSQFRRLLAQITVGLGQWTTLQGKIPSLGAKNSAGSISVVGATDANLATSTLQGTANTSLASIDTKLSFAAPSTSTITSTNVAGTANTAFTVAAANAAHKGRYLRNTTSGTLYLLLGSGTPSATNYTEMLSAGGSFSIAEGEYTGIIKATCTVNSGAILMTEFA